MFQVSHCHIQWQSQQPVAVFLKGSTMHAIVILHLAWRRVCHVMAVESSQMLVSDKKGDEEPPLLVQSRISHSSKKPRCHSDCGFKYRLIKIKEKGAILMIVLNTLFVMAMLTCYQNATFEKLNFNTKLLTIPCLLVLFLCPTLGLLTQCYLGKYKIFQVSIYSLLLGLVLSVLGIFTKSSTVWYMTLIPLAFSTICYASKCC